MIRMSVIIGLAFLVMWATGTLNTPTGGNLLETIFLSWRGWVIIGLLVLLAILYPSISFTKISVRGNIEEERDHIINAFTSYNFALDKESEGRMEFRAKSVMKRLLWQFDDRVTVAQDGKSFTIAGQKKIVPRVMTRLSVFMGH